MERLPNRCDFRRDSRLARYITMRQSSPRDLWETLSGQLPLRTFPAREPENPFAFHGLAVTALEQGDPEKAKSCRENATPAWSKVTTKF
jgi:hypothetical protein